MAKRAYRRVQRLKHAFECSTGAQMRNTAVNLVERYMQRTRLISVPTMVQVEVTNRCNLNCVFCSRHDHAMSLGDLDPALVPEIVRFSSRSRDLILFGYGEPLISDTFYSFTRDGRSGRLSFTTNGMLMTQDLLERLLAESNRPIHDITVSIDGIQPDTYASVRERSNFETVWQNLETAASYKTRHNLDLPELWINFVAMKRNIEELPDLVDRAARTGVAQVTVFHLVVWDESRADQSLVYYPDLAFREFKKAETIAERYGIRIDLPVQISENGGPDASNTAMPPCYMPWSYTYVRHDGIVQACCFSDDFVMGNLEEQSFEDIWNGEKYRRFRATVNTHPPLSCRTCEMRYRYTRSPDDRAVYIKRKPREK